MKAESKTCKVCSKPTGNPYNLCKNCWLALKLLGNNPRLVKKAWRYLKKVARRKIEEKSSVPNKWKSAQQKREWYQTIQKKTNEHFKRVEARKVELASLPRRPIKVVRNGEVIKTV